MPKLISIVSTLLAAASLASGVERESWDKDEVLTALQDLAVAAEVDCVKGAVAPSGLAGEQIRIAALPDDPNFPSLHYDPFEDLVVRNAADESGICNGGRDGGVAAVAECAERAENPSVSVSLTGLKEQIAELHDGLLSPYDGLQFPSLHYVQIEHIVARKEADESGLCSRDRDVRAAFATDLLNLTLAPGSLNASKGYGDIHDIEAARASLFRDNLTSHGKCWWVAQTIRVKSKYGLSVDPDERTAMVSVLDTCTDEEVVRPRLRARSSWVFRPEFLDILPDDDGVRQCSEQIDDAVRLRTAAIFTAPYVADMACRPYPLPSRKHPTEPPTTEPPVDAGTGQPDPREAQVAAQKACINILAAQGLSKTCANISKACPAVGPIHVGEPLFGLLRETDGDGVVCEGR